MLAVASYRSMGSQRLHQIDRPVALCAMMVRSSSNNLSKLPRTSQSMQPRREGSIEVTC